MLSNQGTVGEEYIQLGFMVDAFVKETKGKDLVVIDSYFGPPDFKDVSFDVKKDKSISLTINLE